MDSGEQIGRSKNRDRRQFYDLLQAIHHFT